MTLHLFKDHAKWIDETLKSQSDRTFVRNILEHFVGPDYVCLGTGDEDHYKLEGSLWEYQNHALNIIFGASSTESLHVRAGWNSGVPVQTAPYVLIQAMAGPILFVENERLQDWLLADKKATTFEDLEVTYEFSKGMETTMSRELAMKLLTRITWRDLDEVDRMGFAGVESADARTGEYGPWIVIQDGNTVQFIDNSNAESDGTFYTYSLAYGHRA